MEDLIKKFVYTGVGIASLTAEKLQKNKSLMKYFNLKYPL